MMTIFLSERESCCPAQSTAKQVLVKCRLQCWYVQIMGSSGSRALRLCGFLSSVQLVFLFCLASINVTATTITSACNTGWTQHESSCFCVEDHPGSIAPCAPSLVSLQASGALLAVHVSLSALEEASQASAALGSFGGLAVAAFPDPVSEYHILW